MKYSVKTYGCKVNTYDTALIQQSFNQNSWQEEVVDKKPNGGFDTKAVGASVHVVNTCAVTAEAVESARRWIRQYKRKCPEDRIIVTGCAAQVETEKFSDLKEVDMVVANSHKSDLASLVSTSFTGTSNKRVVIKESIFKKASLGAGGGVASGRSRLFLKIQDGCDSFCTFCVIPFARGKSRSLPVDELVASVNKHYDLGIREVVLTGVHIGDYSVPGVSSGRGLAYLVKMLLERTRMPRIRLSSLEPIEVTDELLELYSSNRLCHHFHLSVQSANTNVLKKMKRKYTAKQVVACLTKIHKLFYKAYVGMDIIAGFCEETQKEFEDTYELLKDHYWTSLHVFPYSVRRYTYASKAYTHAPRFLIKKRADLLRHLSIYRLKKQACEQVGEVHSVLPLLAKTKQLDNIGSHSMLLTGISRNYWTVKWKGDLKATASNKEKLLSIYDVDKDGGYLLGREKQ